MYITDTRIISLNYITPRIIQCTMTTRTISFDAQYVSYEKIYIHTVRGDAKQASKKEENQCIGKSMQQKLSQDDKQQHHREGLK